MSHVTNQVKLALFSIADLTPRLVAEFGYPPDRAESVANRLVKANPAVKSAFWNWWQSGVLDETLTVEGYTLGWLMRERGMKPVAAFLALDWLSREPQAAKATIAPQVLAK